MPETFDYTGARVATDVKDTFGDTGGVQLTDTMILRWLNDGQRQVAQDADFVRSQAVAPLVAGVGVMSLTDLLAGQRLKQVEAITLSGRRLQLIPFPEYLDMLDDASVAATGTPTVGMLRADALTLYPVPDTTVAGALTIYFTQWPLDLADLSEPLSIPARYYVPLRDYVLSQAYQMNDDLDGHNVKLQQFVAGVQGQYERENLSPVEVYPIVPQDEDWV